MIAVAQHAEPIPLGVCDKAGGIGAVSNGDQEIDLIDLHRGALLRRLTALDRPLMIDDGWLIACRFDPFLPGIILHRLALDDPGRHDKLALPTPLSRGVPNPAEIDFKVRLLRLGAVYRLYWQATINHSGGAPPPPHLEAAIGAGPAAGRFDIAVETLKVRDRNFADGFAADRVAAREGEDLTRRAGGIAYRQGGTLRNAPWTTPGGKLYLRTEGPPTGHEQILAIARADAPGRPAAARIEARDPGLLLPELSLDGRHVAVVTIDERRGTRTWRIHDSGSGEVVGRLGYGDGFSAFRVIGPQLVCLDEIRSPQAGDFMVGVERALRAFHLPGGALSWTYWLNPREEPIGQILPQ